MTEAEKATASVPATPGPEIHMPETASSIGNHHNGTTTDSGPDVLESPTSPTSTHTLARFEFESGRGNDGSKILMVQWDPSSANISDVSTEQDGWTVSWEGKSATFSVDDDEDAPTLKRICFLLPSDAPIPPTVTILHQPSGRTLSTKSMPAIYAKGLGVSAKDAGKRGVLHTIWAQKRLTQLQDEIDRELRDNSESVGLEMAIQERSWIVDHFGLVDPQADTGVLAGRPAAPPTPRSPTTPRSPVGGRLGEKLKGLKLSTNPSDLIGTPTGTHSRSPLGLQTVSPDTSETVKPSRSAIPPSASGLKPGPAPGLASLDAVLDSEKPIAPISQTKDTEDELFALPMSPRSPEMKTSPFSFLK
ncbi:hypothetical protein F5Y15DRAFT_76560 [Xylariaceae sp. FL0016]|nr:hypothetical protein F5Y15DRAFT_76560 [Xylariaceae sp. FL0016]